MKTIKKTTINLYFKQNDNQLFVFINFHFPSLESLYFIIIIIKT